MKTKPTQHSVGRLREIGIILDMLICRTEKHLDKDVREKLALFCNVDKESVVEAFDVEDTIYRVPMEFAEQNFDHLIIDHLGLNPGRRSLKPWRDYIDNVVNSKDTVNIAVVGKYSELLDAYKSIHESLNHGGAANLTKVKIISIASEEIEEKGAAKVLKNMHGILIPGGFGTRGHEGKVLAIKYAREKKVPFFGICLGMQMAVVEFARNVIKLKEADSIELSPKTPHPVISIMADQKEIKNLGGTMRLGAYPCSLKKGTKTQSLYGKLEISERHRHRFEFNNAYRGEFEKKGMTLSGVSPDNRLVEVIEIKDHPWFIASQYHPEFKSRPVKPHPLFVGFVGAALENSKK